MKTVKEKYQSKLTTPEEAVKVVKSGDWIDYGLSVSVPNLLDEALAGRADELEDINLRGFLLFRPLKIFEANDKVGKTVFTFNSWHMGGVERKVAKKGYAYFSPMRYCELPEMYRREEDVERVDVLMCQVAPMDKYGYLSFGPTNSNIMEIARRAKHIIVEVNENIPKVNGLYDDLLHIDQVDAVVESNRPIDTLGNATPTEIDNKIAEIVLKEIPDGACLQLGIGGMPNAVGSMIAQSDLKDLGIHTEMYVNSMIEMSKAGVITGDKKNIDRGKQVFAFAAGSEELYEYIDDNPAFASAPVDYVNSPENIAKIDNFISINNAINIDIYGQVNAESAGFNQISGTGGQLDFVIGAYRSKGGKSFICLSSTFKNKKTGELESTILPHMQKGSIVTDPRTTPHYIVTEYGMFNLKGKSLWQRSEGIINLAHPDFREDLIKAAEEQGIWRRSNK